MARFELFYPIKPHRINQPWGVADTFYNQFGFSRHNGEDINLFNGQAIYCPQDGKVVRVGNQPTGGGIFIGVLTKDKWDFPDGKSAYVLLDFLHLKQILVNQGTDVLMGDAIALGDNTGASTGPHCHLQARRVTENLVNIDTNDANNSFDTAPYWNGIYAQDARSILQKLRMIRDTLLALFKGRPK